MPCQIIPFPQELRLQLPTIVGKVDYLTLRRRLEQIDALLRDSGAERDFVQRALNGRTAAPAQKLTAVERWKFQQRSRRALRCTLRRTLLQDDYRGFSCQLAGNPLYQWFCQVAAVDQVRVPSKSERQRFAYWLPAPEMRAVIEGLLAGTLAAPAQFGLKEALDLEEYFLDSTGLKANVHFPTDWVLLRDGVRPLMKATLLIRQAGLRERMEAPEEFLRRMNQLSIAMSQQARRAGSKQGRKRLLRQMKKLVRVVRAHAQRHRDLLDQAWARTEWTRPQAEQILRRLDGVLELLPRAQKQAHERIIGGRPVADGEKILSLYDPDVRVIVRGKAGAAVECGNTVLLGENRQGLILDYQIFQASAPADSQLLLDSVQRVATWAGRPVGAAATDRGFASAANRRALEAAGIFDGTCPRSPAELTAKLQGKKFARLQRRRAQTEGRIGILKQGFLGRPLRAKGFAPRELALAWGVLTHNMWQLARMQERQPAAQPASAPVRQAAQSAARSPTGSLAEKRCLPHSGRSLTVIPDNALSANNSHTFLPQRHFSPSTVLKQGLWGQALSRISHRKVERAGV